MSPTKLSKLQQYILRACATRGVAWPQDIKVIYFGFEIDSENRDWKERRRWHGWKDNQCATYSDIPLKYRLGSWGREIPMERGPRSIAAWASTTRAITRLAKRGLVFREWVNHEHNFFHQGVFLTEAGRKFVATWKLEPIQLKTVPAFLGVDLPDSFVWDSLNGSVAGVSAPEVPFLENGSLGHTVASEGAVSLSVSGK
jgi:DNA-binding MarR family transcriptional regulator